MPRLSQLLVSRDRQFFDLFEEAAGGAPKRRRPPPGQGELPF